MLKFIKKIIFGFLEFSICVILGAIGLILLYHMFVWFVIDFANVCEIIEKHQDQITWFIIAKFWVYLMGIVYVFMKLSDGDNNW